MNDQVKRAAHLEAAVSTMTADIHERQIRRATLFVRALDLACVQLNTLAPTASVEEWRSLLIASASRQARPETCRKDMTPSELVALGAALEELERPKAAERQAASRFGAEHGGDEVVATVGETRKIVAGAIGMGSTSYSEAKHVVRVAEDPEAPPEVLQATQAAQTEVES